MNDQEITAIAGEYAEEKGKEMERKQSLPNSLIREVMEMDAKGLTHFLQWLLRRYALVEKDKVKEEYHEAKFTCGNVDPCSETFVSSLAQKSVLDRLFPDLGKEVEE